VSDRQEVESRVVLDGKPVVVKLISNPTIDDVVVTETRIHAAEIFNQVSLSDERRVQRDIRDFLIRIGVER
jgi:hypothetical protein